MKRLSFWGMAGILFLGLFLFGERSAFSDEASEIKIEKLRFHDWRFSASSENETKTSCHVQFTGVSPHQIFLSMRLSTVKESPSSSNRNGLTIIRIDASQVNRSDFSDTEPIDIKDAWLETSTVSTLGKIKKINTNSEPYFLGGDKGLKLFMLLMRDIQKDGVIIGYRAKIDSRANIFQAPAPLPSLFEKLRSCLSKTAAIF